jgi:hypothetical protein
MRSFISCIFLEILLGRLNHGGCNELENEKRIQNICRNRDHFEDQGEDGKIRLNIEIYFNGTGCKNCLALLATCFHAWFILRP